MTQVSLTLALLLWQDQPQGLTLTPPNMLAIVGLIVIAVTAYLILKSKGREEIHLTDTKRADASEKLVKVRDIEIEDLTKKVGELEEKVEDVTEEYKSLGQIKLKELLDFARIKDEVMAENLNLKEELRLKETQLGLWVQKEAAKRK